MEKILDYLNGRSFEINTLEGSERVMEHFLFDNPDRLKHSKRVTQNMERLLDKTYLEKVTYVNMIMACNLHDIGYSDELRFSSFHPYDAYIYLKENGWDHDICNLVLLHSYARELASYTHSELYPTYMTIERQVSLADLALISLADFTSSSEGEGITINERIEGISSRYGVDSHISQHAELVKRILYGEPETLRLIRKMELGYPVKHEIKL